MLIAERCAALSCHDTDLVMLVTIAYPITSPRSCSQSQVAGLSPVLFGMAQAVGHGITFPRIAGDKYSPGFLASALLHVPIDAAYIKAVQADRPLAKAEWAGAIAIG